MDTVTVFDRHDMNKIITPTIIIDTREQLPYCFDTEKVNVTKKALTAGDYSLLGYENQIAVERKTLDDFAQTVIRGKERFNKELQKLVNYEAACIVVEGDLKDLATGRYSSGASPASIIGNLTSICVDWGIPVYCCSTRQLAIVFTEQFLFKFHQKKMREVRDKSCKR